MKPKSGARIDVKIDIETFLGTRDLDNFDGLVRRSPDGWSLARNAIEQLTCDSALVATLFLLCRHHHRLIHLYGWTLSHDDNWNWTATDAHDQTWTERRPSESATP